MLLTILWFVKIESPVNVGRFVNHPSRNRSNRMTRGVRVVISSVDRDRVGATIEWVQSWTTHYRFISRPAWGKGPTHVAKESEHKQWWILRQSKKPVGFVPGVAGNQKLSSKVVCHSVAGNAGLLISLDPLPLWADWLLTSRESYF